HATLRRATLRLYPGRGVDRVAAVDDVLLDVADLCGHDGSAVEAGLELGYDSIPREIALLPLVDALGHEKDTAETVALTEPTSPARGSRIPSRRSGRAR